MVGCDTFCRLHRSRTPLDLTTFEPDLGALSHLSLHCDGLLPAKELAEELKLARSEGARKELELARAVDLTALGRSLGRSRLTDLDLSLNGLVILVILQGVASVFFVILVILQGVASVFLLTRAILVILHFCFWR